MPTAAIQRDANSAFIYLIKADQTVAMQNVSVGTTAADVTAVDGLQPCDTIVVDGFEKLQNGVRVVAGHTPNTDNGRTNQ
jgi:multidrug efflux system membrane fusion protein